MRDLYFEYRALMEMGELSRRNVCLTMIVETDAGNLRQFRTDPEALLDAIFSLGFKRLSVIGGEVLPFADFRGLLDALVVKGADEWNANILCER